MKGWLAICALLGGGAVAVAAVGGLVSPLQDLSQHPLAWSAAQWQQHPWTLWTAAWVHTSAGSLGGNLLALVALAVLGAAFGAGRLAALSLAAAWPLTTLALLLWPDVTAYAGLGGPIHAAAAVLAIHVARRTAFKPLAVLLFGGIGLKLAIERAWVQPVAFDPSWGFNVVYAAHLAGTVAGAGVATILDWLLARESGARSG